MTSSESKVTDKRLRVYRLYAYLIDTMVFYGGCLYTSTSHARFATYIIGGLAFFSNTTQTLNVFVFCYHHRHSLVILIKGFGRTTTCIAVIVKVCSFLWHRESIIRFHRKLHDFFEEELAQDEPIQKLALSNIKQYCVLTCTHFVVVFLALLGYLYPSLKNIIRQLIHRQIPRKYGMAFQGVYPWALPDGFLYHVHYFFELCCGWSIVFTTCGIDGLFGLYTYQISTVMRGMSYRLSDPLSEERFPELLRKCVEKHKQLLQCKDSLQDLYSPIIFWPVVTNAVIMCALIYEAVPFSDLSVGAILVFVSYMLAKLLQTFIYTWYGTSVITASEEFCQAIYCSKWTNAIEEKDLKTRMILTMMQEPMSIKALKLCSASVGTFTSVLNTAISYFFLLQSMQQRG